MVRRVTPSQFKSMLRQQQQKQRQAVDKVKRAIRSYDQAVAREVSAYNQKVRAHNARACSNRQKLQREINRLNQRTASARYAAFHSSVRIVHTTYERLEHAAAAEGFDGRYNEVLDLSEREAANNAGLMNALLGNAAAEDAPGDEAGEALAQSLQGVSPELSDRWRGALFAMNPRNPDAARHFCTSAREIVAKILDLKAPNEIVLPHTSAQERTAQGMPTRRAKISFLLHQAGHNLDALEDFVEADMDNIVELFRVFNDGTHGSAGTFDLTRLRAIRTRVEDGIEFLLRVIH
jgi:hypothetical protein